MVPRWGVLYGTKTSTDVRYSGKVFVHEKTTGHLILPHYLTVMFPLSMLDRSQNGAQAGQNGATRDAEAGKQPLFLDQVVDFDEKTTMLRYKLISKPSSVIADDPDWKASKGKTVRELSRLWRYMGGNSP